MANQAQVISEDSDDISLYGLFSLFIKNWLILAISGFSFALVALVWAVNQPNVYESETLLMPADGQNGGLSSLSGNLGGLASLAGVSLPEGGNDNSKLALELMKSKYFIMKFIEHFDLVVPIMAVESWDITTNELIIDDDAYDKKNNKWVRTVVAPKQIVPSYQETYEKFKTMINVEQDPKTKFVKFSIEYYSPYIAAQWTKDFISMLNNEIRDQDRIEADESINYLKELIQTSDVAELKKVFSSLMEEQIKSKMLAEIRKDYVFKVVDPAIAPENKSKPKRALIVIAAGFLGGIIGLIIVLFRSGRNSTS